MYIGHYWYSKVCKLLVNAIWVTYSVKSMFRKSSYMLYVNSYKIPNIFNSKTINVLKTINCILLTQLKNIEIFYLYITWVTQY